MDILLMVAVLVAGVTAVVVARKVRRFGNAMTQDLHIGK